MKGGRQEVESVWIVTSLTAEQADPERLLELARQYWSIENGTHYPLDVSAGEDRSGASSGGRDDAGHPPSRGAR